LYIQAGLIGRHSGVQLLEQIVILHVRMWLPTSIVDKTVSNILPKLRYTKIEVIYSLSLSLGAVNEVQDDSGSWANC
jgi:hypothetical protein